MRPSPNLRALILAILGLGLIYKVGVSRGVMPSMAQLNQLQVDELYEVVNIGTVVEIIG